MRRIEIGVAVADERLRRDLVQCVHVAGCAARPLPPIQAIEDAGQLAVDAVLMDSSEPSDLPAIAALRARQPGLRIIAIGSPTAHRIAVDARAHGADHFVRMPFDVAKLEQVLAPGPPGDDPSPDEERFVTADPRVERVLARAMSGALSDATIVIRGETGVGKTTLAHWIHRRSGRRRGPLVTTSCTGLSGAAGDRELFGGRESAGHIRSAHGGTLVLDEVGDLAPDLQERLLRVLQGPATEVADRSTDDRDDVRIIATSREDLSDAVQVGRVREDLRLRLGVIELEIPPLRERPADVSLLARRMADRAAHRQGTESPILGDSAVAALHARPLRGNAWELHGLMQRAAMLFAGCEVDPEVLLSSQPPKAVAVGMSPTLNLKRLEREAIALCLARNGGNRTRASHDLGISVRTLRNKIRQYDLA